MRSLVTAASNLLLMDYIVALKTIRHKKDFYKMLRSKSEPGTRKFYLCAKT